MRNKLKFIFEILLRVPSIACGWFIGDMMKHKPHAGRVVAISGILTVVSLSYVWIRERKKGKMRLL